MSILFLSTTDYPNGRITEFNMAAARDRKNAEIHALLHLLEFQEELNHGKIYRQTDNGDLWFVSPDIAIARLISESRLELFRVWDKQALLPDEKQLAVLQEIGGLPSSRYSIDPEYLNFPAAVITKSGERIDLCLFHFSKSPPYQRYFRKLLLLNEAAVIEPSELALSHTLRLASTQADEIRMSFRPFMVKTKSGELLTYNGTTDFASTGAIKGSDIAEEVEFSYDKFDHKIKDVSPDDITYIAGKWDERLEELFIHYRRLTERKNPPTHGSQKTQPWWKKIFRIRQI